MSISRVNITHITPCSVRETVRNGCSKARKKLRFLDFENVKSWEKNTRMRTWSFRDQLNRAKSNRASKQRSAMARVTRGHAHNHELHAWNSTTEFDICSHLTAKLWTQYSYQQINDYTFANVFFDMSVQNNKITYYPTLITPISAVTARMGYSCCF